MQKNQENLDIFNFISNLLAAEEFRSAQSQFFEQNCHHFENEEENKHEYHQIFQEYSHILDNAIEAKLQLTFTDQAIQHFFEDFEQNYKDYKDQDIIEILFSFSDFEKFKKSMLLYNQDKKGIILEKNQNDQQIESQNTEWNDNFEVIKKYFNTDIKNWKQLQKGKTQYDTSIYSLPFENSGLDVVRVETVFKGVQLKTALGLLQGDKNEEKMKNSPQIKDFRIVKKISENERQILMRIKLPMLSQREQLLHFLQLDEPNKAKIFIKSINLPEIPITKEYIRTETFEVSEYVQEGSDVKISTIGYCDFKGYIPKLFMNMFMTKFVASGYKFQYQQCLEIEKQLKQE